MEQGTRIVREGNVRSVLLALYEELKEAQDTNIQNKIQSKIDRIVAQNYLEYLNR